MRKTELFVPNLPEYKHNQYDWEGMRRCYERYRRKKKPTSIALDEQSINELKMLAIQRGIPYQALMRSFILDGLDRMMFKDTSSLPYKVRKKKKK